MCCNVVRNLSWIICSICRSMLQLSCCKNHFTRQVRFVKLCHHYQLSSVVILMRKQKMTTDTRIIQIISYNEERKYIILIIIINWRGRLKRNYKLYNLKFDTCNSFVLSISCILLFFSERAL